MKGENSEKEGNDRARAKLISSTSTTSGRNGTDNRA